MLASPARAENWPQWRGPALNGSTSETGLPDVLDTEQTLAWESPLPGPGAGTPVVWEDRIFLSALDKKTKNLLALCLDRKSGKILWQKEIAVGYKTNRLNDMASPSPITDGERAYFYYGTGDLAAFDFDGKLLWSRNIQKDHGTFNVLWIYGSSPLLYKGKLYVQVIHRDTPIDEPNDPAQPAQSYLLAIDPATGKDLWRHTRKDDAKAESKESYATPIPFEAGERSEILIVGGDAITGHHPETGEELWRVGGWNPNKIGHWRIVPSPVVSNGLVIVCPPKGGAVFAVKPEGKGEITDTAVVWKNKEFTSDVCVPLYYQNNLYVLDGDKKIISCVDPATGEKKWSHALGGGRVLRASPTGADGKIYCMNEGGDVWVLSASEAKTLSQTSLGGGTARSTIAVAQGQVFVRTADKLYAFAKK
ncbi:MAG: PQQ-binding-like beta-propeller repeat protein [Armatimonadota bacterium]|nr:PQQ-binding-like beta-propeller repeat protein [Armatimonadota bacterium]